MGATRWVWQVATKRRGTDSYSPTKVAAIAVSLLTTSIGGMVAIGMFPKLNDIQTRTDAIQVHDRIRTERQESETRIIQALGDIKESIKDNHNGLKEQIKAQSGAIDKLDRRVWSIANGRNAR